MWTFNCARVYIGNYVGGGTNEFERTIECGYKVISGDITIKHLSPIKVRGTNSEGTLFELQTLVLYPKTDEAIVLIYNQTPREFVNKRTTKYMLGIFPYTGYKTVEAKGTHELKLVRHQSGTPSTIYKMRL